MTCLQRSEVRGRRSQALNSESRGLLEPHLRKGGLKYSLNSSTFVPTITFHAVARANLGRQILSWGITALPPDVRRGLCPAVWWHSILGYAPGSGSAPIEAVVANKPDLYPLAVAHPARDNPAIFEHWTIGSRSLVLPARGVRG